MTLKIVWTPQAEKGLAKVVAYLKREWTENEVLNLKESLQNLLNRISKYPKMYPATGKHKSLHKGLVDKNNYLIYRLQLRKGVIEIINFRGTKQKPEDV